MSDERPAFIVRVQLRSTADGGRQTAIRSNYRPLFDIGNVWNDESMLNDGRIMLLGADELAPGAEGDARLEPLRPEFWDHVRPGATIPLMEGARIVGHVQVVERAWPVPFSSAVAGFVRAAESFCKCVTSAGTVTVIERLEHARRELLALYSAGAMLPNAERVTEREAPRYPVPEGWPGFEEHEVYWEVFDPYEESVPVAGSLSDDILDVYGDVRRGLWHWEKGNMADAVWEWRFSFDTHWGDHAVDALRALHRACRRVVDAQTSSGGA
ncbi:MAG: DUF5063 domain-containing protein [Labilithrix sp.]|nr:DUF5063 domain-containing protein [Labilithrix sp.]